jgi:hypothetical protein
MIAWCELETEMRRVLRNRGERTSSRDTFRDLVDKFPDEAFPRNLKKGHLLELWGRRNAVVHDGEEIAVDKAIRKQAAATVLHGIIEFVERNKTESHSR